MPAELVPGVKVPNEPPLNADEPVHTPVVCGVPPSELNKLMADPDAHTLIEPEVPALPGERTLTKTELAILGQPFSVAVAMYSTTPFTPGVLTVNAWLIELPVPPLAPVTPSGLAL